MIQKIRLDYPEYYELKNPTELLANQTFSNFISPNQIAYNYYWGQENLFIFRYDQTQASVYRITIDEEFDALLNQWLDFTTNPPQTNSVYSKSALQTAHLLYQYLLPDLPDSASNLLIFPDGKLGYLAFESLLTSQNQSDRGFRDQNWLVKTRHHSSSNCSLAGAV